MILIYVQTNCLVMDGCLFISFSLLLVCLLRVLSLALKFVMVDCMAQCLYSDLLMEDLMVFVKDATQILHMPEKNNKNSIKF